MAGGTFDPMVSKVRPGTYVNFESRIKNTLQKSSRGIAVIPIYNAKYGPKETFIDITTTNSEDLISKLGFSVYDTEEKSMLLIREALKNATTVKVYLMTEGTKATATNEEITYTAKFGGTRGNDIRIAVVANVTAGFDVKIYLGSTKVEEYAGITTAADLISCNSNYVDVTGTGNLQASAGISLAGGTDGTATTESLGAFLNALESVQFNAVAFPISGLETAQCESIKSKIKYLRDNLGKTGQFVVPNYKGDYEGIINVTNGVILSDGVVVDEVVATAFVAGLTAGAEYNNSNTYVEYSGAERIYNPKSAEVAEKAVLDGEFFFSMSDAGRVVVEYDINSLTTLEDNKPEGYKKNRFIRVVDTLLTDLKTEFPPAKFNNNAEGWDLMEGIGKSILKKYEGDNAISDVDYENDFFVDRNKSTHDSTYINMAIRPIDSAEKIYIQ